MFTGLIQSVGRVAALEARGGDVRLAVDAGGLDLSAVQPGDSIAVNGVCLTALDPHAQGFAADVSNETLAKTTLGALRVDDPLNLEKSLTLATPLGGHFVSGHVDGVGTVVSVTDDARSQRWVFAAPPELLRYIASKGSVAVDGVSLTVNELYPDGFGVNLIPHTLARTRFGSLAAGAAVNLEVDLIARYVERLLVARGT
ncbi:MAG: riboflavin synthase [Xanthomonadales bacterium]|nr:Riboflavin synthase [Xanthomonadales bacterium]MCC6591877.1 riboflavin synthase [Xanthomonadales bacterium]